MLRPLFYSLTNAIFTITEFLLGLRVVLKLFGASAAAPFVNWVYETTRPLLTPFIGAFPSPRLDHGLVIEFSSLFALIAFTFAHYLLENLFIQIKYWGNRIAH